MMKSPDGTQKRNILKNHIPNDPFDSVQIIYFSYQKEYLLDLKLVKMPLFKKKQKKLPKIERNNRKTLDFLL